MILHYDDGDLEGHFKGLKRRGQGVIVGFDVDNVDAYYDLIHGKGAPLKQAPKDEPWGDRDFAVIDPDGFEIWFSESIKKR